MAIPNKRMIHTKIWISEQVNSLTPLERLLYIGMITLADDDGRLRGDGAYLRHNIFPFDKIGAKKVEIMRDRIAEAKLIIVYETIENVLIQHPKWNEHQKLNKKRWKSYNFPPPPDYICITNDQQSNYKDKESKDKISEEKLSEENESEENESEEYPYGTTFSGTSEVL